MFDAHIVPHAPQFWGLERRSTHALLQVTSFGGHELDLAGWGIDACYSCTQKCLSAPSGLVA